MVSSYQRLGVDVWTWIGARLRVNNQRAGLNKHFSAPCAGLAFATLCRNISRMTQSSPHKEETTR